MRLLVIAAVFFQAALAADFSPAEIVRQVIANDEARSVDPALAFDFTERQKTQHLDDKGKVKTVSNRTRDIHMPDYQRRRERFRKAIREIPEAFNFSLLGEENVRGRPALVLEVSPRPGYDPIDRYSKLYTQLKGKLWVDKADLRWVKIEAELLDTVTFGWILVRLHKGSRVRLAQHFVGEGAWLPGELWYRVSLRIGLVSLRSQETEALYSDYRRAESSSGGGF